MPLVAGDRATLGMPLYMCQPPTGYADRADAWVNTGALLNRMNFALQLVERPNARHPAGRSDARVGREALAQTTCSPTICPARRPSRRRNDPKQAAALTLGSPEFQRR